MKKLFLLILFCVLTMSVNANDYNVSAKIDTNNVLIGDQIKLSLYFKSKEQLDVKWSNIPDTINNIEFLKKGLIDTVISDTSFLLKSNYIVTSFDSGSHTIPSFTFTVRRNKFYDTIFSNAITLNYIPIKIDTSQAIKDIKDPIDVPLNWTRFIVYTIIALIILIGGYFLYKYFRKRYFKQEKEEIFYDPKIPAHIQALDLLKKLEEKKLWQSGLIKQYYVELTDIIRMYFKRRFNIDAMEMTTSEILISLKTKRLNKELIDKMQYLFENADLSKFAKFKPSPEINISSLNYSYDFVKHTQEESSNTDTKQNIKHSSPNKEDLINE